MRTPIVFVACILATLQSLSQDSLKVSAAPTDSIKPATVLKEVTVTGTKKMYSAKNGNLLINMDHPVLAAMTDPVDLLSKIPTVRVSADGETISVMGKGEPLIYIDNQKMSMNDLRSLAVADIKSIEVVNNPSARFEASGRAVIMITRKVNRNEGVKGELNQTAAYRKYYLNRAGGNLSFRKKKIEIKANLQYNQLRTWEGNAFDFDIANHNISSGYSLTAVTTRPQFIGGGGLYWQMKGEDYLSLNTSFRTQRESFPIYTFSSLRNGASEESVFSNNFTRQPNRYNTSNLNYNRKLQKFKANLFTGVQYTSFNRDSRSVIENSVNNAPAVLSQKRHQDLSINVIAARADLERSFSDSGKLELGSSITRAASDGITTIDDVNAAADRNALFSYRETNAAVYTQYSAKRKKIEYSAGCRLENNAVLSTNNTNGALSAINKRSTRLFPKAGITIPLDSNSTVALNYANTISRPNYTNANQTAVYINPYFEWANNINLGPSISQEVSARYQYRDYALAASLFNITGSVNTDFEYNEQQLLLRRTEKNYARESGFSLMATIPFRYKIWNSTNVIHFIRTKLSDPSAVQGLVKPFVYATSSNEVRLPRNVILTLAGWGVTKSYQGAFERNAIFAVDSAITKSFGSFSCTARFNNMFRSVNARESFEIRDIAASGIFYDNSREFSLAVKYSFGKLKNSVYRNRDIDESGNRIR